MTLFHIITHLIFFTNVWSMICLITTPFSFTKMSVRISPICGCNSNCKLIFLSFEKWMEGNNSFFHILSLEWNFYLYVQNLAWKFAHKWSMNWLSRERKDTSLSIMSQKDQKLKRKFTLDIPKFKFQNILKQKTSNLWAFFLDKQVCGSLTPPKMCKYFFCRFWILWTMRRFCHLSW